MSEDEIQIKIKEGRNGKLATGFNTPETHQNQHYILKDGAIRGGYGSFGEWRGRNWISVG